MGATTRIESVTYLKWNDCNFTWDSTKAGKSFADFGYLTYVMEGTEEISVSEVVQKLPLLNFNELLSIAETDNKDISILKKEAINVAEVYWDVMNFILNVSESISFKEINSKGITKKYAEQIRTVDKVSKTIYINKKEIVSLLDTVLKQVVFYRVLFEELALEEGSFKEIDINKTERFALDDRLTKTLNLNLSESVLFSDFFNRSISFKRVLEETINFLDLPKKRAYLNKQETIAVLDRFIRASNAILSNIEVDAEEMTLEQFIQAANKAAGYGSFADFNVGEYEYQKALVRILVSSNETNAAPVLYGVEHHVDIDDTDDRGIVTITDTTQTTKVYYNKHYYNAPEVNVTIKGGSQSTGVIIPVIEATDGLDDSGRYFTVSLYNSSYTRVTGTIAWVSKGY